MTQPEIFNPGDLAWRWPGGDMVYFGSQVIPITDFRKRFPRVVLVEFENLGDILGELSGERQR